MWDEFKIGKFDIYLSQVTIEEINECNVEKKQKWSKYLTEIKFTIFSLSEESISIGRQIIELGILKEKSRDEE